MIISPETMITKNLHPEDIKILDNLECSEKIIFAQNTMFSGEVKVVENCLGRFLKFEDYYQGGIIDHPQYKGNIPYINYFFLSAAIKRDIKNVLILGMGTGYFINQLKSLLPETECIDVVEINPELVEIAENYFNFKKNDINIEIQDGRVFVRNCSKKYDLVILDIFSETGMAYRMMTKEFLEEIRKSFPTTEFLLQMFSG